MSQEFIYEDIGVLLSKLLWKFLPKSLWLIVHQLFKIRYFQLVLEEKSLVVIRQLNFLTRMHNQINTVATSQKCCDSV